MWGVFFKESEYDFSNFRDVLCRLFTRLFSDSINAINIIISGEGRVIHHAAMIPENIIQKSIAVHVR